MALHKFRNPVLLMRLERMTTPETNVAFRRALREAVKPQSLRQTKASGDVADSMLKENPTCKTARKHIVLYSISGTQFC